MYDEVEKHFGAIQLFLEAFDLVLEELDRKFVPLNRPTVLIQALTKAHIRCELVQVDIILIDGLQTNPFCLVQVVEDLVLIFVSYHRQSFISLLLDVFEKIVCASLVISLLNNYEVGRVNQVLFQRVE